MDANVVDWCTRQRHSDSHQRVDGVTEEGNHDQKYTAQAVDDREEQRELQGAERGGRGGRRGWRETKAGNQNGKEVVKGWLKTCHDDITKSILLG